MRTSVYRSCKLLMWDVSVMLDEAFVCSAEVRKKPTLIRKTKGVACVIFCVAILTSKEPFENSFVCVCKLFAVAYGVQSVWARRYAWTEKIGSKFSFQAKKKKEKEKKKRSFGFIQ